MVALVRSKSQTSLIVPNKHLYYAYNLKNLPQAFNLDEGSNFTSNIKSTSTLLTLGSLSSNLHAIINQFNLHLSFVEKFDPSRLDELIEIYLVDKLQRTIDDINALLYDCECEDPCEEIKLDEKRLLQTQAFVESTLRGKGIQLDSFMNFLTNIFNT